MKTSRRKTGIIILMVMMICSVPMFASGKTDPYKEVFNIYTTEELVSTLEYLRYKEGHYKVVIYKLDENLPVLWGYEVYGGYSDEIARRWWDLKDGYTNGYTNPLLNIHIDCKTLVLEKYRLPGESEPHFIGPYKMPQFSGMKGITSIIFPEDPNFYLSKYTVQGCRDLTGVVLPEHQEHIPEHALAGCSNLENITIPRNITYIAAAAFSDCSKLTSVYFEDNAATWIVTEIDLNQLPHIKPSGQRHIVTVDNPTTNAANLIQYTGYIWEKNTN